MSLTAELGLESKQLIKRLSRLRRRLWRTVVFHGGSLLLSALVATAVIAGLLDWLFHIPGIIRALALVVGLAGGGLIFYRHLFYPLAGKVDDLSLALRVEQAYPDLNDGLASTVQFLQRPRESSAEDSASMRHAVIRRTIKQTRKRDFGKVIDSRGVAPAGLSMVLLSGLGLTLAILFPGPAWTAFVRLAQPFGVVEWPKQTRIELEQVRTIIGRNELFEIRGWIRGVVPDKAVVAFRFDGTREVAQTYDLIADEEGAGRLLAKLEPVRVRETFSFQVRANDASTAWQEITVLPPPVLVPLEGQPSPQVQLEFPAYTDLPTMQLTPGIGNIDAVDGTRVSLRAAADRPLAKAWIEFLPQSNLNDLGAFLAPLATATAFQTMALSALGQLLWGPVDAQLESERKLINVNFLPHVTGLYILHFEDEGRLHNSRIFELQIQSDPAPTVTLTRPNERQGSLSLLPGADFRLQVTVEDPTFAVRGVWLEYRCSEKESLRSQSLYDDLMAGSISTHLAAGSRLVPRQLLPPPHLRPKYLEIDRKLSLSEFKRRDASHSDLKEGDVLTLQVAADDFDNVSTEKLPGLSNQVQIRIISRNAFDVQINQDQAKIEQEIVRLREQEREAIHKAAEADKAVRKNGKLTREQTADLVQAEMLQQQIRESIGAENKDGLRSEVDRIRQTLKDNHVPRSDTDRRLEDVAEQLERLARDELPPIEPRLTEARKLGATGRQTPSESKDNSPLAEARKHQDEVEKTLTDLLSRLEAWSSTQEIKGEAKSILEDQKRLRQETERLTNDLQGRTLPQANPSKSDLTKEQVDQLHETEATQQALEERTAKLLEKMKRVARERKEKDPRTAEQLSQAQEQAVNDSITDQMQQASKDIGQNQLNKALGKQSVSIANLEKLAQALEKEREAGLDQLVKKLRQAEKKLAELIDEQEKLNKKMQEAAALSDPQRREEDLKRLAREQEGLQKETQDLLKELSRLRAGRASQALAQAGSQMNQAGQRLQRGQSGEDEQDEALDRLNEAQQELQKTREEAEDQLAREQVAKATDLLMQIKQRQDNLVAEGGRIQKALSQGEANNRPELLSLLELGRNQAELGQETAHVTEERLSEAKVFSRLLKKVAQTMNSAGEKLQEHSKEINETGKAEDEVGKEAYRLQNEALARLNKLLEALKMEPGAAMKPALSKESDGQGGKPISQPEGDGIPSIVELKLLRTMQAEVNDRTEEFDRDHSDLKNLTEPEKTRLQELRREQQEIADLLEELMNAMDSDGETL